MDIENENNSKQNKKTKTKKTKQYKNRAEELSSKKTLAQIQYESKNDRLNRSNQLRRNKINEYLLKKRGIIDSDGNSTLIVSKNKSMSFSNLTQLIDMTQYKIPPKICALIALNDDANLDLLLNQINKTISENLNSNEKDHFKYILNENVISYIIPGKIYKGKERLTFIKTYRDVYSILDACKVADIIIFVTSCKKAEYDKWKLNPEKHSFCIDTFGYKILSMIRTQGLTEHISIIQDLYSIPVKYRQEIKKLYIRYFESEVKSKKIFSFFNPTDSNEDNLLLNDENEIKGILRLNCALSTYMSNLDLRKHRSYMLIEDIKKNDKNSNNADIYGYIRGNTLIIGKYVHITGFGDYKIEDVDYANDPLPVKYKYENNLKKEEKINKKNKKMEIDNNNNNMNTDNKDNNNNNPIIDDNIEGHFNKIIDEKNIQPENIKDDYLPKTKSEQKSKNQNDKLNEINDDIDIDFNINIIDDNEDISYHSEDEDIKDINTNQKIISNKHKDKTTLQYRTKEEMEFQDEVDTPFDISARERFKKYRGLESMKTGSWDPLTDLPKEYGHIFSFDNIKNTFKIAVRTANFDGLKISGNYVKITIINFNFDDLKYVKKEIPLVLSTLLDHERKLCVMNYKITPYYEEEDKYIQNLNKKVLECQCGFRRYLIKPIFSVNLHNNYSDKIKYQKYIEKDKFFIMTCFSQLTYVNNPVLIFLRKQEDNFYNNLNLCGTGITLESDSKKIILKKIILTGYPVKIKKKKAVVRYMFFNPEDINYFKPIQLVTKNGLRGNIKESVGTHGYMKCYFSDYLKSNDTVCLNLYKRIFPKWFIETWKYKIFNGNREDYFKLFENNFK